MKVISFAGGGIRGISSLCILERLGNPEKEAQFLAGTSTGAIIAAAIGIGIPTNEIIDLYKRMIPEIFGRELKHRVATGFGLWGPRYSPKKLQTFLESIFSDMTMADSSKYLLIPTFDLGGKDRPFKAKYFNSHQDKEVKIVDCLMASAGSAPLYFPRFSYNGRQYIDGGIATNFAAVSAISEAVNPYRLNVKIENVRLLEVCTGLKPSYIDASKWWGLFKWAMPTVSTGKAPPILDLLLNNQESVVGYQSMALLGPRYKRIQFMMDKDVSLDDASEVGYMMDLANTLDLADAKSYLNGFW